MGLACARWEEGGMRDPRQCTGKQKWLCNDLILTLWPGKFPRTSCFSKIVKNECVWVHMDLHGCGYSKTRGVEPKIFGQCKLFRCGHGKLWSRGSERVCACIVLYLYSILYNIICMYACTCLCVRVCVCVCVCIYMWQIHVCIHVVCVCACVRA